MTGAVSWEQLLFIVGVIVAIITLLTTVFSRIFTRQETMHKQNMETYKSTMEEQGKLRHDLRTSYDQKITVLDERLREESRRIDQIEIFNAGLRILVQTIEEFKNDVKAKFDEVTRDRKEEIRRIDDKLDKIINDQQRRRKEIDGRNEATA